MLQTRFSVENPIFIENMVSIAYKETKDEFEDPDEEVKRIFVSKLFIGISDWKFGLFLQEVFKNEYKASTLKSTWYKNVPIILEKRGIH